MSLLWSYRLLEACTYIDKGILVEIIVSHLAVLCSSKVYRRPRNRFTIDASCPLGCSSRVLPNSTGTLHSPSKLRFVSLRRRLRVSALTHEQDIPSRQFCLFTAFGLAGYLSMT